MGGGLEVIWVGADMERDSTSRQTGGSRAKPRGHLRKGHWHKYLIGPRIDSEGNAIPAAERNSVYHWIHPVWCSDRSNPNEGKTYAFEEQLD